MNILVLNYEYPPLGGGAGPVCQQLSEEYARGGHQVEVVTMAYGDLPRRETRNGVRINRVPALRKKMETCETPEMLSYVLSAFPRVVARLRRRDIDAIHCHFLIPTGLLAWAATRRTGTPYIVTAHGSDVPGFNPDRFKSEHRMTGPLLRAISRNAHAVVTPSLYLQDLARQNIGAGAYRHIPNGIGPDSLHAGPKKKRLLMAGRLLPRKGFQHVLRALEGVQSDVEIHIAGDGPLRDELETLAGRLGVNVIFHGWLEHGSSALRELYESAAVFCLPSERENASIALLEAMLAGAAVITSNDTGCAETIGDAGFTVAPGDVNGLREALLPLLASESLCAEWGARARQRVLDRFTWTAIASQYVELLEETAKKRAND
jgi:glycosyltransferase involved in cell wall biosynthesis